METTPALRAMRGRIVRASLALLAAGLFVLGLVALGKWAQEQLRGSDKYAVQFSEIDCETPPSGNRQDFLGEVQYLAGLPDRLQLLDEKLKSWLSEAFARHPWVQKVEAVEITPPRQVRVRLIFRKPVLAVSVSGKLRAVDAEGILLPAQGPTADLPVFEGQAFPPAGPAGTPWGDVAVEKAARKAAGSIK